MLAAAVGLVGCSGSGRSRPAAGPHAVAGTTPASPATTVPPRPPPATTTAARLATELTRTETAIRDRATPAARLASLGRVQQPGRGAVRLQPQRPLRAGGHRLRRADAG